MRQLPETAFPPSAKPQTTLSNSKTARVSPLGHTGKTVLRLMTFSAAFFFFCILLFDWLALLKIAASIHLHAADWCAALQLTIAILLIFTILRTGYEIQSKPLLLFRFPLRSFVSLLPFDKHGKGVSPAIGICGTPIGHNCFNVYLLQSQLFRIDIVLSIP